MPHIASKSKKILLKRIILLIANFLTPNAHDYARWGLKNRLLRLASIKIGKQVIIDYGLQVLKGCEDNISIGDQTVINSRCSLYSYGQIKIGKFCMLASDISIINGGHDRDSYAPYSSDIVIGNGVWIGHRATIVAKQRGINIGDNAIVGAGSLLISDVPKNAVVAGNPAKIIGYRKLPDCIIHLDSIKYDPMTFEAFMAADCFPESIHASKKNDLMSPSSILANSILSGGARGGTGGMEILAVRVVNEEGVDTLSVEIGESLLFYIYAKAANRIEQPYFSIGIFNLKNEIVFVGNTVQISGYCNSLEANEEIVIGFKVKMTVESGQYTFRLSCAEPLKEYHPNKGNTLDSYERLGPISVLFDYDKKRAPFYGMAQLPMEML